jgi:hypothetical protein
MQKEPSTGQTSNGRAGVTTQNVGGEIHENRNR